MIIQEVLFLNNFIVFNIITKKSSKSFFCTKKVVLHEFKLQFSHVVRLVHD